MPFARIFASNPSSARDTVQALRQAGYDVEIVPPGTHGDRSADLEFDADNDAVISESTQEFVPGEREFFLKPLWRHWTASYKASKDIERARRQMAAPRAAQSTSIATEKPSVAPVMDPSQEERLAVQRATLEKQAEDSHRQEVARERELEFQRAESRRRQEEQERLELARRQEEQQRLEAARRREEEQHRQELAIQREAEQQRLAALRQAEELKSRQAEARRQSEEATRRDRLARESEEIQRQEVLRQQAEEEHRRSVLRQRQQEEQGRRAEAQRLLLAANKQREESIRQRAYVADAAAPSYAKPVPGMREYFVLRLAQWKNRRAHRDKVTSIDRSSSFAWRQALPITAGVAAAFLLGWGIAVYDAPKTAVQSSAPPILTPGQYAAYPVQKVAASRPVARQKVAVKKHSASRDSSVAEDEVVVKHYYPSSKNVTAQNRAPQRKKISDLN